MSKLKVRINKEKCLGCGTCFAIAPEVFEMDADGKAKITPQFTEFIVEDEAMINKIVNAKAMCPNEAIETEIIP